MLSFDKPHLTLAISTPPLAAEAQKQVLSAH
jgi:hypothetical protein